MVYSVLEYWLKPSAAKGKGGEEMNFFFPLFSSIGFLLHAALKLNINFAAQE